MVEVVLKLKCSGRILMVGGGMCITEANSKREG